MALREAKFGDPLTPREASIRDALCDGMFIKQIGGKLGITYTTVHHYIPRVYTKLGAKNAHDLVRIVLTERFGRPKEIAPIELIASENPKLAALIKAGVA